MVVRSGVVLFIIISIFVQPDVIMAIVGSYTCGPLIVELLQNSSIKANKLTTEYQSKLSSKFMVTDTVYSECTAFESCSRMGGLYTLSNIRMYSQPKIRGLKLRSGVNWWCQGALKQKRCKTKGHKTRDTCT